jgi:rifampicin phosphotransferase
VGTNQNQAIASSRFFETSGYWERGWGMVLKESAQGASSVNEWFIDLTESVDPTVAGAKAAGLARLHHAGFPTLSGVVIPAPQVSSLSADSTAFRDALETALQQLGSGPFAIRSSGVSEDLDDASHAGQYETVLDANGIAEVLAGIERVVRSATSDRLEQYHDNIASGSTYSNSIAVLIQPMLAPSAAGVAFSANPVTGNREEIIINAVTGVANKLMDGEAPAEEWIVQRDQITRHSGGPEVLERAEVKQVAELTRQVEGAFGAPQDIEWAIVDGNLTLLQTRPITALPIRPDLPELSGYWTKELEHFAPPVSLMTWSIHQPNLRTATQAACEQFGLLFEALDIEYRAGEIYEHEVPLGGKEDMGAPPPWWLFGILARVVPEMRRRMRLAREAIRTDLEGRMFERWETEWASEMDATSASLRSVDMETLSDVALANHIDSLRSFTKRAFYVHFQLAFPCILPVYRLVKLGEELFGWDEHQTLRLVYGTSHGTSAGSRDLDRIAAMIRSNPVAAAMFEEPGLTLDRLEDSCPEIAAEISQHLETHGMRLIQNELGHPTFMEMPSLTLQFIRDRLSDELDEQASKAEATAQEAMNEARTLLSMRSEQDRERFDRALERAAQAYATRDSISYPTLGHPWALLRFGLIEAGRRIRNKGILRTRDDIFYCTFEEAQAALRGGDSTDLGETAHRRRMEALWTAANPGPDSFGVESAMPEFRGLPKEAREIHEGLIWGTDRVRAPRRAQISEAGIVSGVPASPGRYQGTVRVIRNEQEFHRLQAGDVLVCPSTSSSWAVLFGTAGALVTDQGGSLSHPAIIAREHGIPAVVATVNGTERLKEGQVVIVDGTTGRVELVEAQ